MIGAPFVATGSALAFTLGLVALLAYAARRFGPGLTSRNGLGHIDVLSRSNLAPRQGVATIRVEGRMMVVSFGDGGVRHIADVEPVGPVEERESRYGTRHEVTSASQPTSGFADALVGATRKVSGLKALSLSVVLLLGVGVFPAAAQQPAPQLDPAVVEAAIAGLAGGGTGPQVNLTLGDEEEGLQISGTVGTVIFIGFMTMIPTLLLMTTSFTRILIVLHLLKQALGTQTAPPAHLLAAMALLLTGFVMAPTFEQVHQTAIVPWMDGEIDELQMLDSASVPMRDFMLRVAREQDLRAFLEMRQAPPPETVDDIPFVVVTSAFVTSELTSAFQIGFALFLPFVVIDVVVASVLMSMGMFMLPPVMVSLPFKLLLFVLVDGWALVLSSLVQSF